MENYIVYRRKSTDSEDRQILSLESQENAFRDSIPNYDKLNIVANFEESKSAKAPGRKKFNEMCSMIEEDKASFIICWALNRLARNGKDGGTLIWLVQHKHIKIITPSRTFDYNDLSMMYMEFAMSNQFIVDLQKNTKRGLNDKIRMGLAPQQAPIGYINDTLKRQGERDILIDPARFSLVRDMWDLLLTGQYSPPRILQIATDEWGLRHRNGNKLSRSRVYDLFRSIFYTGKYSYVGEIHQGKHTPMITLDEYNKAQGILGVRGFQGVYKRIFAFKGFLQCDCGGSVTAYERFRKICTKCHHKYNAMTNTRCPKCSTIAPEKSTYFCYYPCINSTKHKCKQPAIRSDELEKQLDEIVSHATIPQEFIDWGMEKLRADTKSEQDDRQGISKDIQSNINNVTKRLDALANKYISSENIKGELFSDEEYKNKKTELQAEKLKLEDALVTLSNRQLSWLDTAEKSLNVARDCQDILQSGTNDEKIEMMYSLGLHLTINNKIVRYDWPEPYKTIVEASEMLKQTITKFEPEEGIVTKGQMYNFDSQNPLWGDRRDSNPQRPAPQAGALPLCYGHH